MADAIRYAKHAAAQAAVAEVEADMLVGLGTGTTAAFAIEALGARIAGGLVVTATATSFATERAARAAGIPMRPFEDIARIDLAIDGADEIDPLFRAIKGGGGAMVREKIVASAATRMICIVDDAKLTPVLRRALPIEVLPFARSYVSAAIIALGGEPRVRRDSAGTPLLSDQSNLLMDCAFGEIVDPAGLAAALDAIAGLVGHGLFLDEIDVLIIGGAAGTIRRERPE